MISIIFVKEVKEISKKKKSISKGAYTIGIVAPSGPLTKYTIDEVGKSLNSLGYNVKFGESTKGSYKGYLASDDLTRAKDIEYMFLDKSVDIVMCIRGGYGASRILDKIDYSVIQKNPKIFIGFSDITALHIVFNQKCKLVTYHGPMAGSSPDWDEFTYQSLLKAIIIRKSLEIKNPEGERIKTLIGGEAKGRLIGGNLSLIVASLKTPYEIDTCGKILFIEEIGETIYKLDRMLTQLSLAGKFDDCEGIIFGDFCDCNKQKEDEFTLEELLINRVGKFNKPCVYNLKAGHCMPMVTLPLGAMCRLDANNSKIEFI